VSLQITDTSFDGIDASGTYTLNALSPVACLWQGLFPIDNPSEHGQCYIQLALKVQENQYGILEITKTCQDGFTRFYSIPASGNQIASIMPLSSMCATTGPEDGSGGGGGDSGGGSTLLCGCPNGYEPASSVMIHLEDMNPDPNKPNISGNYVLPLVLIGPPCYWSASFGNSGFFYTITLVWWPEPGPAGVYYLHLNLDSLNEGYICPIGLGNTAPENNCIAAFITQPCTQQN
jgi:hypothetical protein